MPLHVFISLTVQDTPIAEALRDAFRRLIGEDVRVSFSSSKELSGGIRHGTDWFQWIVSEVKECDFALILITPASVQKPWILWEAGAVYGAAVAVGDKGLAKVRPIIYQLTASQLPSPIRDSKTQFFRGDREDEVEKLFTQLLEDYQEKQKTPLGMDRLKRAFISLPETIAVYMQTVRTEMLDAPAVADTEVIEEWRIRLEQLLQADRASEAEHLHDWMDIAFGRDAKGEAQPLDMRIHNRLAELYLRARKYDRAIQQLELSRRLAPRDIFVLRTLGKAYLEKGDRDQAKDVIDRIQRLDKDRWVRNVECAALAARWHREGHDAKRAEAILEEALRFNPESYYLANLLGEVALEIGNQVGAVEAFTQALKIVERLTESNIWTHAVAANAAFVIGEDQQARQHLEAIAAQRPDAGSLASVTRGLQSLGSSMGQSGGRLQSLLDVLRA